MAEIKELKENITDTLTRLKWQYTTSSSESKINVTSKLQTKKMFDDYAHKMLQYQNITDEVEWNELTANEFVTSIQTTIGNTLFIIIRQRVRIIK